MRGTDAPGRAGALAETRLVLGMAGFWAFFYTSPYPAWALGAEQGAQTGFVVSMCCSLALFGVLFGLLERARPGRGGRAARTLAGTGLAFAALLALALALGRGAWDGPLAVASGTAVGAYTACLGVAWGRACGADVLAGRDVAFPLTAAMLVCALVMSPLSQAVAQALGDASPCVLLALAASAALCPGRTAAGAQEGGADAAVAPAGSAGGSPLRPALMVGIVSLYTVACAALRVAYALEETPFGTLRGYAHTCLLAILLALSALYSRWQARRGRPNSFPWIPYVLVCVTALYIAVLFAETMPYVSNEVLLPTRPLATLYIWGGVITGIARMRGGTGTAAGCVALPILAANRMSSTASFLAWGGASMPPSLANALALSLALALTLGLVAYLALPLLRAGQRAPAGLGEGRPGSDPAETSEGAPPPLDEARLAEVARRHGLSERESQVLVLIAQGNSRAKTAELLNLSVNSVQTYARGLYRKMGVHSRQELVDMARRQDERGASDDRR